MTIRSLCVSRRIGHIQGSEDLALRSLPTGWAESEIQALLRSTNRPVVIYGGSFQVQEALSEPNPSPTDDGAF